jgi:WD40 repeat protein
VAGVICRVAPWQEMTGPWRVLFCRIAGTLTLMDWSPDSQEFATIRKNSVVFYDAATLLARRSIDLQFASDIAYSPDGSLVALGSWEAGVLFERENATRPLEKSPTGSDRP